MQRDFWVKMGSWGKMGVQRDFWVKNGVHIKISPYILIA